MKTHTGRLQPKRQRQPSIINHIIKKQRQTSGIGRDKFKIINDVHSDEEQPNQELIDEETSEQSNEESINEEASSSDQSNEEDSSSEELTNEETTSDDQSSEDMLAAKHQTRSSSNSKQYQSTQSSKTNNVVKNIEHNIKKTMITIEHILNAPITMTEKEMALQIYDMLKNMECHNIEYHTLNDKLKTIIQFKPQRMIGNNVIEHQISHLYQKMNNAMPTLSGIVSAYITESDKIRALQLYNMYINPSTDVYHMLKYGQQINDILRTSYASLKDVQEAEVQESLMKNNIIGCHMDLKRQIFELDVDINIKSRIYEMYSDMILREPSDDKYRTLRDKIQWAIRLPYNKIINCLHDNVQQRCLEIHQFLDAHIYGMTEVKEHILQIINAKLLHPKSSKVIAFKGAPGVGKTKLTSIIAKSINLPFEKISLGGVIDTTFLKGSDNVWSGASPSILLQILARLKCSNPIIILDEVDKLGSSEKGIEVQNALLHILDPSQNNEFQDHFLNEFSHDISNVWFLLTMNEPELLTSALRDRLTIIDIPSYHRTDIIQIIIKHIMPDALRSMGLKSNDVMITEDACDRLLDELNIEMSGIRIVEQAIHFMLSRICLLNTMGNSIKLSYSLPHFKQFPYTIEQYDIEYLYE